MPRVDINGSSVAYELIGTGNKAKIGRAHV